MDAVEHDLNPEQWAALQAAWGGCAYCGATGAPLQRDCVLPISPRGRYTARPRPGSRPERAKGGEDGVLLTGWLWRKRLDERAFLGRHVEIAAELAARFGPADGRSEA